LRSKQELVLNTSSRQHPALQHDYKFILRQKACICMQILEENEVAF